MSSRNKFHYHYEFVQYIEPGYAVSTSRMDAQGYSVLSLTLM